MAVMNTHDVLEKLKFTIQSRGKIYNKNKWLWDIKTAYYRQYSEFKFHNNFINHIYGWMALIALTSATLMVVLLATIAMPGIAMLGVGLAITAIAVGSISVLAKHRWNAHLSMMRAQSEVIKGAGESVELNAMFKGSAQSVQNSRGVVSGSVDKNELKQLLTVHDYLAQTQISTDHRYVDELCEIIGVTPPQKKMQKKKSAQDFAHDTGENGGEVTPEEVLSEKRTYRTSDAYLYSQSGRPSKSLFSGVGC